MVQFFLPTQLLLRTLLVLVLEILQFLAVLAAQFSLSVGLDAFRDLCRDRSAHLVCYFGPHLLSDALRHLSRRGRDGLLSGFAKHQLSQVVLRCRLLVDLQWRQHRATGGPGLGLGNLVGGLGRDRGISLLLAQ